MSRYWAEIDGNKKVLRVVVCDTFDWLQDNLGGTWVETADPYSDLPQSVTYCGIGFGYDPEFPERFASAWRQPVPGVDDEDGSGMGYERGSLTFHNGRIWRSTTPGNVWEPGVSAWHDAPQIDGVLPRWVQPTGEHDTYPEGFELTHNGEHYVSERPDNAWEPGTADSGWRLMTEDSSSGDASEWVQPTGGHDAYDTGDRVTHNGATWESRIDANVWEPGTDATLWAEV